MSTAPCSSRLSRDDLEFVLDAVSDAVFTVDRDFVITSFNRAAEANTGLQRADVLGRRCYEVLHSTVCDYVAECPLTQLFDGRGVHDGHEIDIVRGLQPGGSLRVSVHALRDGEGGIVGGIEMLRPFTAGEALHPSRVTTSRSAADLTVLDASERRAIEGSLQRYGWNRSKVCEELGFSRTTLWRKMRRLGISPRRPRKARR
jgi:PAS domain S-box-containing protein